MHGPGDVRIEDFDVSSVVEPIDTVIEVATVYICGSNLWPYRDPKPSDGRSMDHECVGIVTEIGDAVENVKAGNFVVGFFCLSDSTCEIRRPGYQSRCVGGGFVQGVQTQYTRVPLTSGTLVVISGGQSRDEATLALLLAVSDVLGAGWFGAVATDASPSKTTTVMSDGTVGLMTVLAAKQLDAERTVIVSHHEGRATPTREFGATDVAAERGDAGTAAVKKLTGSLGAHDVVETVNIQESVMQVTGAYRPGGHIGYVGISHGILLPDQEPFFARINLLGGPTSVCRFLPDLVDRIPKGKIGPDRILNFVLPLDGAAGDYKAMGERRAIKVLFQL